MASRHKNQKEILEKLGIAKLNEMQLQTHEAVENHEDVVLLSPTGTGKTLAFLLPVIACLDSQSTKIQAMILAPSRELAMQIEQVIREMGTGHKTTVVYGGRAGNKDKIELKHAPAILVGTPGRIADHMRRENIDVRGVETLVLDEFDKSLEVGFEGEMMEIMKLLPNIKKKILTSATEKRAIPDFVGLTNAKRLNFLSESESQLLMKEVVWEDKGKFTALQKVLGYVEDGNGIIFCNLKDTIQEVAKFLDDKGMGYSLFYGGMEQLDRETALIKFRNGTNKILLATDLAARGIDVPALDYIIHFELPQREDEFIHRNGRTARMQHGGTTYILKAKGDKSARYRYEADELYIDELKPPVDSNWDTLYISGGRKDKISKGDIVGLFLKQAKLPASDLGTIELKQDCAFVAVSKAKSLALIKALNNSRLKTKKVRLSRVK